MPVFCLFTLGRHGNFTEGVTSEQPDLLCTALEQVKCSQNRKINQQPACVNRHPL
jgi:hypothetical protein